MTGILLITHQGLGESLVECVRHVMGNVPDNLKVLSVMADEDTQRKEKEGRALIAQMDSGAGVLILADMFGATPSNIARRLRQPGHVEVVAGVNLPMLLRAVCYREQPLAELVQKALQGGRECIVLMGKEDDSNVATGCADN
ncbi:MAG: PTS fructose transporter subunit IIA [Gallionellaceae bacterium]|nr:PTS fructose transporter subunit IIA [Gallionellaceae bacterium]